MKKGVFSLLASRRFGPFFFTQFLGAFNDNVFRQALILLIAIFLSLPTALATKRAWKT